PIQHVFPDRLPGLPDGLRVHVVPSGLRGRHGLLDARFQVALAVERVVAAAPEMVKGVDAYAHEAMDLTNVLSSRLEKLPPDEFEGMLRPAFQEDEWLLIAVGAALGFCVGVGQVLVFKFVAGMDTASEAAPAAAALFRTIGIG
ncbi:MAG: hypothetical protein R3352_09815, partial [Salinisphaeraceae bacterium]|nr:hypothetical protein [Salinisphaeraceae bacterium]